MNKEQNDTLAETSDKIIVLRSAYGKQKGPVILYPAVDATGRMIGVDVLTEEEKRKVSHVVTIDSNRKLTDGYQFNLNVTADAIDWKWVKECDEVVMDPEEALSNPNASFYVEDLYTEISKKTDARKKRLKAGNLVSDSSAEEQKEIYRLLGNDASYSKPWEITDSLSQLAEENPDKLISMFNDPNRKSKKFIFSLTDAKIIKRNSDSQYYYGSMIFGTTISSIIEFVQNSNNIEIVTEMNSLLNPNKELSDKRFVLEDGKAKDIPESKSEKEKMLFNWANPVAEIRRSLLDLGIAEENEEEILKLGKKELQEKYKDLV